MSTPRGDKLKTVLEAVPAGFVVDAPWLEKHGVSRFLTTLHDGDPDFEVIGLPQAADLPAVRWKLLDLKKLIAENPDKHKAHREELEKLFT